MWPSKQACIDCHFFIKQTAPLHTAQVYVWPVSEEERQRARANDYSWRHESQALGCHFGVWDEGHQFDRSLHATVVLANRRNFCFFWRYRPLMMLDAARTLQEREAADRKAARDRWLTIVGLWIAALAL